MNSLFPFHLVGSLSDRGGIRAMIGVVLLNTILLAVYVATVVGVVNLLTP